MAEMKRHFYSGIVLSGHRLMFIRRRVHLLFWAVVVSIIVDASCGIGQTTAGAPAPNQVQIQQDTSSNDNSHPALEDVLPQSIAQNLEVNVWGWFSDLHDSEPEYPNYWEADLAFGATERIGENLAVTADIHFIDEDNYSWGFLEQAFVTADVWPKEGTLISIGKFNANIGVEPRNAWDRFGGTTSLLFGAEPQDFVGVMLTQPLGDTGITLRPFVSTNLEGYSDLTQAPSGGVIAEYRPAHQLSMELTNWVGPGYFMAKPVFKPGAPPRQVDYTQEGYSFGNWTGPDIDDDAIKGTLYLVDGHVTWLATPDLTLSVEGLLAMDGPSAGRPGWSGMLALANYDLTDKLRVFAQWSYLNDNRWFITSYVQICSESSGGVAYEFIPGAEIRGEFRHDISNRFSSINSVSVHITFGY